MRGTDGDHGVHAGKASPLDRLLRIGEQAVVGQVCVRIDQIRPPGNVRGWSS
jgi:hypothetical protein